MRHPRRLAALAATLGLAGAACAQAEGEGPGPAPLWELGLFGIGASQPAYPGSAQRVRSGRVLPYVVYRGERVRAERGSVGVRVEKTDTLELDVGLSGSFGSSASEDDARRGMPEIGTLVEFGPRLRWRLGEAASGRWTLQLPLRGVFDASNGLRYQGLAFEPELGWGRRSTNGWFYGVGVSAVFGNRPLADTFYGVAPEFALPERPTYRTKAGLINTRLGFNVARRLGTDWRVFGFARWDSVAGAANEDSPLVDRRHGSTVGLGVIWTGWRSDARGQP
jgi:MipA family protein